MAKRPEIFKSEEAIVVKKRRKRDNTRGGKGQTDKLKVTLREYQIDNLEKFQQDYGTYNRSHSIGALIDNIYGGRDDIEKPIMYIKSEKLTIDALVHFIGQGISLEDCYKCAVNLFDSGRIEEIRISNISKGFYDDLIKSLSDNDLMERYEATAQKNLKNLYNYYYRLKAQHVTTFIMLVSSANNSNAKGDMKSWEFFVDKINEFVMNEYSNLSYLLECSYEKRFSLYFALRRGFITRCFDRNKWSPIELEAIGRMNSIHQAISMDKGVDGGFSTGKSFTIQKRN